ncbi:MAG: hypothetical protein WKF75_00095, partial [Singulisphaera sp.]
MVVAKAPRLEAGIALAGVTVFHRKVPAAPRECPGHRAERPDLALAGRCPDQNPVVAARSRGLSPDGPRPARPVLMPEARKLTLQGPAQVLAESATGDPLYAVIERPEGKVVVLTVNLDKGDLTLQTAFPILMTNLLGWFAAGKGDLREALSAGAVTELVLPVETDPRATRSLRAPDGRERPLPANSAKVAVGPLDRCGVWSVVRHPKDPGKAGDGESPPLAELACNLANRRE